MKLIVGLGNPGQEYEETRHNAGFMVVEALGRALGSGSFEFKGKFDAAFLQVDEICLAKPQTFMNGSGMAVQKIMQFYKIPKEAVLVVHDDLDIKLGEFKVSDRGPKVHNGVNSIREAIGEGFTYVRVGVDARTAEQKIQMAGRDYVLQRFSVDERQIFNTVVVQVVETLQKELVGA